MKKIFVALCKTVLVKCLLIVVLTFLVFSCGDNLTEEYFIDIKPPADISTIDLRLQGRSHSLKIFKPTQLKYKIGDGTTKIYSAKYSLDDKTWTVYSSESTIDINPGDYSPGSYKLKLDLVMSTGTNSIADNIGLEKYVIQKEWDLILDGREAPSLKPLASISKDSLLVIKWPKADHYDFKYYEISANSGFRHISKKISNVNDTTFCDPLYAGEGYRFTVDCITGNSRSYGFESSLELPTEEPQLYIEEIGYEELRVN
ncbi:hypothetical protein DWB61_15220 [Ancylomarina euxinus]|uniref:Fibronectin type-III domain-containing protein n=1 Tax=Ancylomarina euxinus TaxID=2283627 RepID=A0A425XXI3_9BACT|nr:hypothetical protein [Ancylomarina euxinus]MCZ4694702.1 hypothetical protein [Ancylomarina euxinus]MUP16366.1 hypothetical protein [Ancylomarina euxinus]RRG19397.1 hypothetical protein DWB61_15220 [Ancylomarina euxinus]